MKFDNFKIETWDIFPNPCYNPQESYGNAPATFYDLMCDERVPANDRIWAFANCTLIPDNIKRFAAVRFVRETPIGDGRFVVDLLTHERSVNALDVAMRHAAGLATDDELAAACDAARDAALDAVRDAAWAAVRAAALDAVRDAAWDAAWAAALDAACDAARDAELDAALDAVRDAAWAAVRDAELDATWDAQIEVIKSMINDI